MFDNPPTKLVIVIVFMFATVAVARQSLAASARVVKDYKKDSKPYMSRSVIEVMRQDA